MRETTVLGWATSTREAELQALLWCRICDLGFRSRLEHPVGAGRLDLTVADREWKIFMGIELTPHGILDRHREQVLCYVNELKSPVAFIASERQAGSLLKILSRVDPDHVHKREGNSVIAAGGFDGVFFKRERAFDRGVQLKSRAHDHLRRKVAENPRYG